MHGSAVGHRSGVSETRLLGAGAPVSPHVRCRRHCPASGGQVGHCARPGTDCRDHRPACPPAMPAPGAASTRHLVSTGPLRPTSTDPEAAWRSALTQGRAGAGRAQCSPGDSAQQRSGAGHSRAPAVQLRSLPRGRWLDRRWERVSAAAGRGCRGPGGGARGPLHRLAGGSASTSQGRGWAGGTRGAVTQLSARLRGPRTDPPTGCPAATGGRVGLAGRPPRNPVGGQPSHRGRVNETASQRNSSAVLVTRTPRPLCQTQTPHPEFHSPGN